MIKHWIFICLSSLLLPLLLSGEDIVTFRSGHLTLHAVLYKPEGAGPFPAVVYNHGSAGGMLSKLAFDALGPVFASHGWVFFGPYRRGQGLSAAAGPYIGDQIAEAVKNGGTSAGAATMVRLLETDHLHDQLSGLGWLKKQGFVKSDRIAVAHHGCDPHSHIWTRNQIPATGVCKWNRGNGPTGATELPPPGMLACSTYPTWPYN